MHSRGTNVCRKMQRTVAKSPQLRNIWDGFVAGEIGLGKKAHKWESSFPYPSLALLPTTIRVMELVEHGGGAIKGCPNCSMGLATERVGTLHISKFGFSSWADFLGNNFKLDCHGLFCFFFFTFLTNPTAEKEGFSIKIGILAVLVGIFSWFYFYLIQNCKK